MFIKMRRSTLREVVKVLDLERALADGKTALILDEAISAIELAFILDKQKIDRKRQHKRLLSRHPPI